MRSSRPGGWIPVAIGPGSTTLERMPSWASSRASPMDRVSTAPLEVAYMTYSPAPPSVAMAEEMNTMAPPAPPGRDARNGRAGAQESAEDVDVEHLAGGIGRERLDPRHRSGYASVA